MKRQTLTAAALGALAGSAIVNAPVTVESKRKPWADLTRHKQQTIEVNAGLDFRVVSCQFPVTVQLDGEWHWKDRQNYK